MKFRTRIAPIALTAALSLGLAACGGDDPEPAATDEMTDEMDGEMTESDDMDDDMTESDDMDDDMTESDDMDDDMTESDG